MSHSHYFVHYTAALTNYLSPSLISAAVDVVHDCVSVRYRQLRSNDGDNYDIGISLDDVADDTLQAAEDILQCVACNASTLEKDPAGLNSSDAEPLAFRGTGCAYCKALWWLKHRGILSWKDLLYTYMKMFT